MDAIITQVESLNVGTKISALSEEILKGAKNLLSVDIPRCVSCIGENAMSDCNSSVSAIFRERCLAEVESMEYYPWGLNKSQIIPEIIPETEIIYTKASGKKPITVLIKGQLTWSCLEKSSALDINNTIEKVIIGHAVTSIGAYSFYNCRALSSVSIPESVSDICDYAFSKCFSLTEISFQKRENDLYVHQYSFYDCNNLSAIDLPDGLFKLGNNAFENCYNLISIVIPGTVAVFDKYVFKNCDNLSSAIMKNGINSIPNNVFYSCESLREVIIPQSVVKIDDNAFDGCVGLYNIVIPSNVNYIGNSAFLNCFNIMTHFSGRSSYQIKEIPDKEGHKFYPWGLNDSQIDPEIRAVIDRISQTGKEDNIIELSNDPLPFTIYGKFLKLLEDDKILIERSEYGSVMQSIDITEKIITCSYFSIELNGINSNEIDNLEKWINRSTATSIAIIKDNLKTSYNVTFTLKQ